MTLAFDIPLENLSVTLLVASNLFILRDRAFIFGMYVPYDKNFLIEP